MSFPVTWLPPPVSYSLVGSEMCSICQFSTLNSTLQPLPGDFRSNDVTSGSLPITWGHVTSFPLTWLPPPASYSPVGSEIYSIGLFSTLYSHFQVTSSQKTSLPVTWGHVTSFPVTWLPAPATSRWLPVKWRHYRVTSGHLRSGDVNSYHVTASSCEPQPCRNWNVQYMLVFGPLHPLQGDYRSNDVTYGHCRSLR